MNRRFSGLLLAAITLIALSGCVAKSDYLKKTAEAETLSQNLSALTAENTRLKEQIGNLTAERDKLASDKETLTLEKGRLMGQRDDLTA